MTDTTQGAVTEPVETRTKIANRDWINDAGEVVSEELSTGVRYEFLGRTKEGITIPPDGKPLTVYFRDLTPTALKMLAGFGAITLMGNVTNTWMGDKADDKEAKASDAIAARLALLNNPDESQAKWIDRSGTGGGARIDKDALALAMVEVYTAAGKPADVAVFRARLDDAEFLRAVRSNDAINAAYAKAVGKQVKSLDDILGMVS